MSDRKLLFTFPTNAENRSIELFMDGETGTWQMFLHPDLECIDLTLTDLRGFYVELGAALFNIDARPDEFNAEVRNSRQYED